MGVYVVVHLCVCTKVIRSVREECLTPACESDVTVLTGCHGNRGHRASLLTDCVYCHKEVQERMAPRKGEKKHVGRKKELEETDMNGLESACGFSL